MKKMMIVGALFASVLAPSLASAATLADGGFEAQGAASTGNYCYFGTSSGGQAPCTSNTPWSGTTSAGLQIETNAAWPGVATPDGSFYAFIQNLGSISQTFTTTQDAAYDLGWLAAGRPNYGGGQSYSVTLTDAAGAIRTLFNGSVALGQPFTANTVSTGSLAAGTYTLSYNGLNNNGDNTAFIDAVSLAAVPEPATWGMMILGFMGMGLAMRRQRRAGKLAAA